MSPLILYLKDLYAQFAFTEYDNARGETKKFYSKVKGLPAKYNHAK